MSFASLYIEDHASLSHGFKKIYTMKNSIVLSALGTVILTQSFIVYAQEPTSEKISALSQITVIGDSGNIDKIAGSATLLDKEILEKHNYSDINRLLQQVPGVNIYGEDGYGLRPNIGMRGVSPVRSRKISIMEDGVLASPAPYTAPSAYYSPMVGRMSAVEVIKGSAAIKYGPNTTAGALNFISTPIPHELKGQVDIFAGSYNYRQTHAYTGESTQNFGWLAESYQVGTTGFKNLDGGGNTGFTIDETLFKVRLNSDEDATIYQEVELKLLANNELSNETYIGLSDDDFDTDPYRRYAITQKDKMEVEHRSYQLRHYIEVAENVEISTVVYQNETRRDWYKAGMVDGIEVGKILANPTTYSTQLNIFKGIGTSADDAVEYTGADRNSIARGIQTTTSISFASTKIEHNIELGLRIHYDDEDRDHYIDKFRMENGSLMRTTAGAPRSELDRKDTAKASSFFIHDEIIFGNWIITPGVRYESVNYKRVDKTDPTKSGTSRVSAILPGIGGIYKLNNQISLLSGIHKGFSPPGAGSTNDVDPEESTNLETGFRYRKSYLAIEMIGFYTDYANLLGVEMAAAGGTLAGGSKNGGKAETLGLEALLTNKIAFNRDISMPLTLAYTYATTEFKSNFDGGSAFGGTIKKGDKLIYIPEHQLFLGLGLQSMLWSTNISTKYTGEMRSIPSNNALENIIHGYTIFDLSASYNLTKNSKLFASVENLTNKVYFSSHNPTRNMVGKPRTFMLGMKMSF
jgi:Fe(3+) dicitrate transport protein